MIACRLRELLLRAFMQILAIASAALATTVIANINKEVTAPGHLSSLWWARTSTRAANGENCDIDETPGLLGALDRAQEAGESAVLSQPDRQGDAPFPRVDRVRTDGWHCQEPTGP